MSNPWCLGIFRERAHSPGREFDDAEILRLTGKHLEAKGFQDVRFTLSDLGLHEMTLHNIAVENLSLKTLTVSYSLLDFLQGKQS